MKTSKKLFFWPTNLLLFPPQNPGFGKRSAYRGGKYPPHNYEGEIHGFPLHNFDYFFGCSPQRCAETFPPQNRAFWGEIIGISPQLWRGTQKMGGNNLFPSKTRGNISWGGGILKRGYFFCVFPAKMEGKCILWLSTVGVRDNVL